MASRVQRRNWTVDEVEAATGKSVASLDGVWAGDMLERPAMVKASGVAVEVIEQAPGRGTQNDWVVVAKVEYVESALDNYGAIRKVVGEPIEVEMTELIPLCVHCYDPLVESGMVGPGQCRNAYCFLCDPWEDDGTAGEVY